MIYTAWHLWNERNRRIFADTAMQPVEVVNLIKEDMALRARACGVTQSPPLQVESNQQAM